MSRQNIINGAIAFVLATLAWASIRLGGDNQMSLPVKVTLSGVPSRLIVTEKMKDSVTVMLRGTRAGLSRIREEDLGIEIDVSDRMEGTANLDLDPSQVKGLSPGVTVASISPSILTVKLETLIETEVTLKENLVGNLPEGYSVKQVEIIPAQIRFRGPARLTKKLADVLVEPVEARTLVSAPEREVSVIASPDVFPYLSPRKVTLRVQLTEETVRRTLTVPLTGRHRDGHRIQTVPDSVTLTVSGPASAVKSLSKPSFEIEGDFSPFPPGRYRRITPKVKIGGSGAHEGLEIGYEPKQFDAVVTAK